MICTKCKQETVAGAVFCPWCGKKLTATKKTRVKSRGNGTGTAFKRGSTWTAQVVVDRVVVADDKPLRKITRSKPMVFATFFSRARHLAWSPSKSSRKEA